MSSLNSFGTLPYYFLHDLPPNKRRAKQRRNPPLGHAPPYMCLPQMKAGKHLSGAKSGHLGASLSIWRALYFLR